LLSIPETGTYLSPHFT